MGRVSRGSLIPCRTMLPSGTWLGGVSILANEAGVFLTSSLYNWGVSSCNTKERSEGERVWPQRKPWLVRSSSIVGFISSTKNPKVGVTGVWLSGAWYEGAFLYRWKGWTPVVQFYRPPGVGRVQQCAGRRRGEGLSVGVAASIWQIM